MINKIILFLKESFKASIPKFIVFAILLLLVYITLPWLGYDNPLEEAVQNLINSWLGQDIDLTPEMLEQEYPLE